MGDGSVSNWRWHRESLTPREELIHLKRHLLDLSIAEGELRKDVMLTQKRIKELEAKK